MELYFEVTGFYENSNFYLARSKYSIKEMGLQYNSYDEVNVIMRYEIINPELFLTFRLKYEF